MDQGRYASKHSTSVLCSIVHISLHRNVTTECHPRTRTTNTEAEAHVRESARPANTADLQHGVGCSGNGELAKHDGHSGRYEAGQQGTQEAVWED